MTKDLTDDWSSAKLHKALPDEMFSVIRDTYVSHIVIPKNKLKKQIILCPVGMVGAGKSTVTIPLAKKLDLLRISTDEIRKLLKENSFNFDRAREIAGSIAIDYLQKGYSIAVDANCGSVETKRLIEEVEKKYDILPIWFLVDPPVEFIKNKLKNFNHTWLFRDGDDALRAFSRYEEKYMGKINNWAELSVDFIYTFDTSKENIADQIDECYEKIIDKISKTA